MLYLGQQGNSIHAKNLKRRNTTLDKTLKDLNVVRLIEVRGTGVRRLDWTNKVGFQEGAPENYYFVAKSPDEIVAQIGIDRPKDLSHVIVSIAGKNDGRTIVQSPKIPWLNGFAIVDALQKKYPHLTIEIGNEMEYAAIGMSHKFGHLYPKAACSTISNEINTAITENGKIIALKEDGHVTIDHSINAPICSCGSSGHLEAAISSSATARRVREICNVLELDCGDHPNQFLDEQFDRGTPWARELIAKIAIAMGFHLSNLISWFDFEIWIIKGTFGEHLLEKEGVIDMIREVATRQAMPALRDQVDHIPIVPYSGTFPGQDVFIGMLTSIGAI
jgi:predicted NBD/HSP70 family sugar kinase